MKVVLTAIEDTMAEAWEKFCGDVEGVSVYYCSIFNVDCDAVVSPANSFGFMDGGVDYVYSKHFGWHVQDRVKKAIKERHYGELLVGQADIVATDDQAHPYLIAAPTMRVPLVLRESVNAYLAARAVLLLVKHGTFPDGPNAGTPIADVVKTVAFPGMGTGVGRLSSNICAFQVRAAIDTVLLGKGRFPSTWSEAENRHIELFGGNWRNLQNG